VDEEEDDEEDEEDEDDEDEDDMTDTWASSSVSISWPCWPKELRNEMALPKCSPAAEAGMALSANEPMRNDDVRR
jgi:hypothetical protein